MPNAMSNIIDFPKHGAANDAVPLALPALSYHYAGFLNDADGKATWIDGVIQLVDAILTQEHYLGLKNKLAKHYDIPENDLVITSLTRLNTLQFEAQLIKPPKVEVITAS